MMTMYHRGEPVIYRLTKSSIRPGPRAQKVAPAPQGDSYSYLVEKFWVVRDVLPDGRVVLATRRGKEHVVPADDPNLRHARWWERLVYRGRFPQFEAPTAPVELVRPKQRSA
jgi:hypothetical protein